MLTLGGPAESDLRDLLRVLSRRKGIIIASFLLVVAAAVATSLVQTPVYQATAELLLQRRSSETLFGPSGGQAGDPSRFVATEIQILHSRPVQDAVTKKLGSAPPVGVSAVGDTDVVAVNARSTVPTTAATVANAYARAYIDYRRSQEVEDLGSASTKIQNKINDLQNQIKTLDTQTAAAGPQKDALATQRQGLTQQQDLFRRQLDTLSLSSSLNSGGAQIVTPATDPTTPVSPRPKRNAAIGGALGLLLGLGLAFLFDFLDDRIKSKEDLEALVPDLPVLALIPEVTTWKNHDRPLVISATEPTSPAAEAYRTLRTSLQFMAIDRPMRVIQVTSAGAVEGKTTTLSNLSIALRRAGQRVVVVCCDLRRPRLNQFFDLPNQTGFTSVLLGDVQLSNALQPIPGEERAYLLASGPPPPNPSELLGSPRTSALFNALRESADVVLVDSPPVVPVTDASIIASRVDATLLVVTVGETNKSQLKRAIELLRQVDAPLIGCVLNGVGLDDAYGYAYQYRYVPSENGRSSKPPKVSRRERRRAEAESLGY